ncbi:DNA alkylation repair protein [Stieleria varia]|uniref:DNA alkylation repair protein n=1 Tax=Stieleria varia TaxID=2528005 RepID=UPI0018D208C2|nr:DNA alkylation repair protein [Stieleria varia]
MNLKDTLSELRRLGSDGTRQIYLRHGASEPLFGVKFGDLAGLKKRIGVDHELASLLWKTGNSDAQTLALMVIDPNQLKSKEIDDWMRGLDYDLLVGMLAGVVAKTRFAITKWTKWSRAKSESSLVAAYSLVAHWLKQSPDDVPDTVIEEALKRIADGIHDSPNRARHAMNNALIAIGVFSERHRGSAIRVAEQVGKVTVDHGQTGCKTPDAVKYIAKSVAHYRKRGRC